MKNMIFVFSFFLIAAVKGYTQNQAEILKYNITRTAIDSIGESLADIALQNPQLKVIESDARSSEYTWQASRLNILNDLSVSGNLNEYSIKGVTGSSGNLLYPRYNIGVRVPIGELFTTGKLAKSNYYKFQSDVERLKVARQNLRVQVITYYHNYAMTQKLLALQQEVLQDELVSFSQVEEKFKNGEATLDIYTRAGKNYNSEQVKQVMLDRDLKVLEANLEGLLGMSLTDAFRQIHTVGNHRP